MGRRWQFPGKFRSSQLDLCCFACRRCFTQITLYMRFLCAAAAFSCWRSEGTTLSFDLNAVSAHARLPRWLTVLPAYCPLVTPGACVGRNPSRRRCSPTGWGRARWTHRGPATFTRWDGGRVRSCAGLRRPQRMLGFPSCRPCMYRYARACDARAAPLVRG